LINDKKLKGTYSFFGRLLLIFLGLAVAIAITIVVSYKHFSTKPLKQVIYKNIYNYAYYLTDKIGTPPTVVSSKKVADETGLVIGVLGEGINYRSIDTLPDIKEIEREYKKQGLLKIKYDEFFLTLVERDNYIYIVGLDSLNYQLPIILFVIIGSVSVLLILIAYLLVLKMFSPLFEIKEAAHEFAKGNFEHKLKSQGSGLLVELSNSVQDMSFKIKSMLDGKRELLLAIAHELRTPITTAKLHLEFIENSERREKIGNELNEMSELISNILESERLKDGHERLELKEVNISSVCRIVIDKYFGNYNNISLEINSNPLIIVDEMKYSVAIKNIISNAITHGGDKKIRIIVTESSLSVIDYGPGIPADQLNHITEAFFRVDKGRGRKSGGVGLGLYLVKQIIDSHGHKIEISSDKHTEIKFIFHS
jgi:signal transduction histidine kinase